MPSSRWQTQNKPNGIFGESSFLFSHFKGLLHIYYNFQFCGISLCVNVCVSASICVSCAFSLALFLLFALSYSSLFSFILSYFIIIFKERKRKMWVRVEGEVGGSRLSWKRKTVIKIYCKKKSISILKN